MTHHDDSRISIAGKVAIVTGAAGGIGATTSHLLARRGAKVLCADLDGSAADQLAAEIAAAGFEASGVQVDLADESAIKAMIETAVSRYGGLDILNNNAADQSPEQSGGDRAFLELKTATWDRAFTVNTRGTMIACREAVPHMLARGGGSIINMTSNLGLQGNSIQIAYSASKAAIMQLTRSVAASFGKQGIRCNCVSPGLTMTPKIANLDQPAWREVVLEETLTPYLGGPEDVSSVVAFLASDEARYISGHNLVVDGGLSTHVPGLMQLGGEGRK